MEQTQIGNEVETQVTGEGSPAEETTAPDPVAELKTQNQDLASKVNMLSRQLGERDRGLARLSEEVKQMKQRHGQAIDRVARTAFGVEDQPETPYGQIQRLMSDSEPETPPANTPATQTSQPDMDEVLKVFDDEGLNPFKLPPELVADGQLIAWHANRGDVARAKAVALEAVRNYKKGQINPPAVPVAPAARTTTQMPQDRSAPAGSPPGARTTFKASEIASIPRSVWRSDAALRERVEQAQREGRIINDT